MIVIADLIINNDVDVLIVQGGYKYSTRGMSSAIVYVSEDYIDIFLKEHWSKYKRIVYMIKHGRCKRIRNKYINMYERERLFVIRELEKLEMGC